MPKVVFLRTLVVLLAGKIGLAFDADLAAQTAERQNWYFGVRAGLSFSTATPTVLTDGMTTQVNATACMSDANGTLLFYTDGSRVWNRYHQVMANGSGLDGDAGNYAQQVVIVHHPGDADLYYIFYVSSHNYPVHVHRLKYSIVNMSNGDGVVESKNTMLPTDDILQKITAVEKRGEAFWVVTQGDKTGKYFCVRGTSSGLEAPVITDTGIATRDSYDYGELRFSPDGKTLAATNTFSNRLSLFRFDFATGMLKQPLFLNADGPASAEFSPDGKLLYVTSLANCSVNTLYQYNVSVYSGNQIVSSRKTLGSASNIGMLQRGPDNRIYVGRRHPSGCNFYDYIGSIDQPNVPGAGAMFNPASIYLQGGTTFQGLPNFATILCADLTQLPKEVAVCNEASYTLSLSGSLAGLQWDNGSTSPVREVNNTGNYWVESKLGHCVERDTVHVVFENATIQFEEDTVYTFGNPVTLSPAGDKPGELVWHDHSTGASYSAFESGEYSFTATLNGCVYRDTISVVRRELFIPNVITANGDARNDFFVLPFIRPDEHWEVHIYNRYGIEIFSDLSYKNNWQTDRTQLCFYRVVNKALDIDVKGPLHVLN